VILNNPKGKNTVNDEWISELERILNDCNDNNNVNCVLIWAQGSYFTAGLDLAYAVENFKDGKSPFETYKIIKRWQKVFSLPHTIKKPTIVAVNGYCVGAGIDFISSADVRFCTKDSKFSIAETKIGIVADLGTLQRIGKIVGSSIARQMVLSGESINSNLALQSGLVSTVYENKDTMLEEARALCLKIASLSPYVVQASKLVMNFSEEHSVEDGLEYVALWNVSFLGKTSDDIAEAISSFYQKKKSPTSNTDYKNTENNLKC